MKLERTLRDGQKRTTGRKAGIGKRRPGATLICWYNDMRKIARRNWESLGLKRLNKNRSGLCPYVHGKF